MTGAVRATAPSARLSASWIRRRVRNMYRRRRLLSIVAAAVFAMLVVVLAEIRHGVAGVPSTPASYGDATVDTTAILDHLVVARAAADSIVTIMAHARAAAAAQEMNNVVDSVHEALRARRDSLLAASAELGRLLHHAVDAPLPASYRALGNAPELRGVPRIARLLDTLAQVERSRAAFGAAGGVDPIFVALTARASQIGRGIEDIARARYTALRLEADSAPLPRPRAAIDTLRPAIALDSAQHVATELERQLVHARSVSAQRVAEAGRRGASTGESIPVSVLLAASLVLGLATAFLVVFSAELRTPRVADASEAERVAEVPVLVTVRNHPPAAERHRRQADRDVPPLIDQVSDEYRVLHGQLADRRFELQLLGITGDHPIVTAIIAANLAAATARQVRTTILVDTDAETQSVATVTRAPSAPGMADVLAGRVGWSESIATVVIGRGRTMDVIPAGAAVQPGWGDHVAEGLGPIIRHLARRYESVFVSAPCTDTALAQVLGSDVGAVIISVRVAATRVSDLRRLAGELRARGAVIRGLVLWDRRIPTVGLWSRPAPGTPYRLAHSSVGPTPTD